MRRARTVVLSPAERAQLEAWARSGPARRRLRRRARIVLEAAEGRTNAEVAARVGVHLETAARWRTRFVVNGLEGLSNEAPRAGSGDRVAGSTVRRIVRATLSGRPATGKAWSTRSLARSLRVSHMLVHRVWTAHHLSGPSRPSSVVAGAHPRVDLGGAFLTERARAVVFTVDDRSPPADPVPRLPELVPNPTTNPEFSGSAELSQELVRAVGAIEAVPGSILAAPANDPALLVFLRAVERKVGRSVRLEAVFDRPLSRLGRRAVRWFSAHPRFRVFTPSREQRWSDAVDAWLRRWEAVGFDRESFGTVQLFVREFPSERFEDPRKRVALNRFSWTPQISLPVPRSGRGSDRRVDRPAAHQGERGGRDPTPGSVLDPASELPSSGRRG